MAKSTPKSTQKRSKKSSETGSQAKMPISNKAFEETVAKEPRGWFMLTGAGPPGKKYYVMVDKQSKPANTARKLKQLRVQNESLRAELDLAKESLAAIQSGDIDALVVHGTEGSRIFTLQGADHAYRELIEQMAEGAVMLNADSTIHYCNRGFAHMLKRPLDELIGTPVRGYIVESDQPAFASLLLQAWTGSRQGEFRFLATDGRVVCAQVGLSPLVDGSPVTSMSMVVVNLTERKRAEYVLANAEFTERLIEATPIGVAVVGRDMRYVLANAAYQTMVGDSAASLVGRTIAQVLPPAVAQLVESAVQQVLRSGQPIGFREYAVSESEGIWWKATNIPLSDANGDTENVLIVAEDVSERKRTVEELKRAKMRAEQSQIVAESASKAKDDFLAVLSHELRTPLVPVLAAVSILQKDPRFEGDGRDNLDMIRRNAELEARLIDDLLDVTRIERGKIELHKQPVDLKTILHHAAEVCVPVIEARKLQFEIESADGPYVVDGDPARLQQVFWNLVKNAIKFTPVGGRVGIHCHRDGEAAVIVQVTDSGRGIEPDLLPHLFNAFEQGGREITRQFGGLGLGLAISKNLVEMHGGTIKADSEGKGKGATFSVRLPLLPAGAAVLPAPPTSKTPAAAAAPSSLRILLVEDHDDTAQVMRRVLSAQGHEVQIAGDVATALRLAGEQSFNLLISDLGLPDGSGLDLMRALRAKGNNLPGIALSGYGQEKDIEASREAGFVIHLVKPVNLAKLKEEIAKAVGNGGGGAGEHPA